MDFILPENSPYEALYEQSSSGFALATPIDGYDYAGYDFQMFFSFPSPLDGEPAESVERSMESQGFLFKDICAGLGQGSDTDAVWEREDVECHLSYVLIPPSKGKLVMFDKGVKYIPEDLGLDSFTLVVGNNINGRLALIKVSAEMVPLEGCLHNLIKGGDVRVSLSDLPGQSLGLTSGTSITLDTNGAGHGWYFDWLGSGDDWLSTSDPQEWMARPGSAADGRIDVLTVFFHEYGHALGLEHGVDAHDLMATTLTPGVRRLPSPDDMALFAAVNTLAEAGGDTPQPYSQPSPDHC